jgi:hypothetical protein
MTAALLLLTAQTMAAPIPEPFAVLDSVPPPKGRSAEEQLAGPEQRRFGDESVVRDNPRIQAA